MKFSSTDKRSESVSLIRNKKIYFIGRNECLITKIECWPVFKQDPDYLIMVTQILRYIIHTNILTLFWVMLNNEVNKQRKENIYQICTHCTILWKRNCEGVCPLHILSNN